MRFIQGAAETHRAQLLESIEQKEALEERARALQKQVIVLRIVLLRRDPGTYSNLDSILTLPTPRQDQSCFSPDLALPPVLLQDIHMYMYI